MSTKYWLMIVSTSLGVATILNSLTLNNLMKIIQSPARNFKLKRKKNIKRFDDLLSLAVSRSKCNNVKFMGRVSFKVKSVFRKEKLCWTLPA